MQIMEILQEYVPTSEASPGKKNASNNDSILWITYISIVGSSKGGSMGAYPK